MNINNIINQLAANPEELEKKDDRRGMLKGMGTKLAAAAVPFAISSLFTNDAQAQSKETINNVLNYIYKNEQIVAKILTDALAIQGLAPFQFRTQFELMITHNEQHRAILVQLMDELGGIPVVLDPNEVDFTAGKGSGGGQFRNALSNTEDFLLLAQTLTETMVRIYKGQITEILSDKIVVRNLSSIHSVKVRQATFIRFMRTFWIRDAVKPWITNNNSDSVNPALQSTYSGESKTSQEGIELVRINGYDINQERASEAFDEPFNKLESNIVMDRFIKI